MLKNVKLKKLIKSTIMPIFSAINKVVPKDDRKVLLYGANFGIEHNLKPLKDFLIEEGYNKKYSIQCGVSDKKYFEDDGLKYSTKIETILFFLRARHVFYTAGQIPIKPSKSQIVIHMNHGTSDFKTMGKLTKINNGDEFFFSYICVPGDYYVPIAAQEYGCSEENVYVNSEPMTDALLEPIKEDYHLHQQFSKVLVWLPTFRQSDFLGYSNSTNNEPLLIFKESEYSQLNKRLEELNILLIVKLHPAQTLSNYKEAEYSNLWILSNEDMKKKGYDLYQLVRQSDALVGDYSSISLQYLLMDKPLAFVIPDIDVYAKERGFVFSNPEEYMPGHKTKKVPEFYSFLNDIAEGKDDYKEERHRIKKIIHKYDDGKSCERLMKLSKMSVSE